MRARKIGRSCAIGGGVVKVIGLTLLTGFTLVNLARAQQFDFPPIQPPAPPQSPALPPPLPSQSAATQPNGGPIAELSADSMNKRAKSSNCKRSLT